MIKVLAILSSKVLYGKERSNIEVYTLIRNKFNADIAVVINKGASSKLKEAVSDLVPLPIMAPERHGKRVRSLIFLWTYALGNFQLLWHLIKIRPDLLLMNSEITFYDFYPALIFYRGKILYRIGDEPAAYHNLSMHFYNSHVWRRYILKRVTKVVCISRYIYDCFAKEGRDMSKDTIIYNYPPTRKLSSNTEKTLYKQTKENTIHFGFLGQIFEQKGVHHYIECALNILETHPETIFYVAGSLKYIPDYAKKLQEKVSRQWKQNIIFLGEITDIETFFQHIDVLCIPSIKQEPLGNVLVEAKKYSCPCIIYPTGGMPELISHGIDGFICKTASVDSLMEGILYYINNKPLINEQGRASYDSIEKLKIDRKHFEEKWIRTINDILT